MKKTITDVVSQLENISKTNGDVFDTVGILVDDIFDIGKAPPTEKRKQKKDCLRTLQYLKKQIKCL